MFYEEAKRREQSNVSLFYLCARSSISLQPMPTLRLEGLVIASKDVQKVYWTFSKSAMDAVCIVLSQEEK
jgi:hypothetical protein